MRIFIYLYFVFAIGKALYFFYYKKFEEPYSYCKRYVIHHWLSAFLIVLACCCMAIGFDSWTQCIVKEKDFWLEKAIFLIGTGAFFLVDSKIVLEEEKFKKGTYTLDELPCYKNRYFLRSITAIGLLSSWMLGGGIRFFFL